MDILSCSKTDLKYKMGKPAHLDMCRWKYYSSGQGYNNKLLYESVVVLQWQGSFFPLTIFEIVPASEKDTGRFLTRTVVSIPLKKTSKERRSSSIREITTSISFSCAIFEAQEKGKIVTLVSSIIVTCLLY